jgi:hypothetical protein
MKQNLKAGSAAFLAAIALGISVRVYADGTQDSTVQPPSNQHVIGIADLEKHLINRNKESAKKSGVGVSRAEVNLLPTPSSN